MPLTQSTTGQEETLGLVSVSDGSFQDSEIENIELQEPVSEAAASSEGCSTTSQDITSVSEDIAALEDPTQFDELNKALSETPSSRSAQGQTDGTQRVREEKKASEIKQAALDNKGIRMFNEMGLSDAQVLEFANGVPDELKSERINEIYDRTLKKMNQDYNLAPNDSFTAMGSAWQKQCYDRIEQGRQESYCKMNNFFKTKAFYESLYDVLEQPDIAPDVNKFEGYQSVRRAAEERAPLFGFGQPPKILRLVK